MRFIHFGGDLTPVEERADREPPNPHHQPLPLLHHEAINDTDIVIGPHVRLQDDDDDLLDAQQVKIREGIYIRGYFIRSPNSMIPPKPSRVTD